MATINGTNNNDTLSGGGQDDLINGLDGNDVLDGGNGNDTINGDAGNDQLFGGGGTDTLNGSTGNDSLYGGSSSDFLSGGADNDLLNGGSSGDTLSGGDGIDTVDYAGSNAGVSVNLLNNAVSGGHAASDVISGFENIAGSSFNDTLTGDNSANALFGGALNDTLAGNDGADSLFGGTGTDSLSGGTGNDSLSGDEENDTLNGDSGDDSLFGGAGNDSLSGGTENDLLVGGAGSDTLIGGTGTDTVSYASSTSGVSVNLQSGAGLGGDAAGDTFSQIENITGSGQNDTLTGDNGASVIYGGGGADVLDGRNGNDLIGGDGGNDTIAGGIGNDTLSGDDGNDRVFAGTGSDQIAGGIGDDVLYGDSDQPSSWTYRFYDKDFGPNPNQAFNIETNVGGPSTLRLEGTTTDFDLRTMAAQARGVSPSSNPEDFGVILTSSYTAGVGGVYRFTTTSDDGSTLRILDANGNPLTFANETGGNLSYLNNDFHQSATTRFGNVTLTAGQTYTIEIRIWENLGEEVLGASVTPPGGTSQNLIGNAAIGSNPINTGNDTILAGDGNDTIYGEAGNDSLSGEIGNDLIDGGTGNDQAFGGSGADTLFGGGGDDSLEGGDDDDLIYGDDLAGLAPGANNDTIFGGAGNDTIYGGSGNDLIFGLGGNDSLYGDNGKDTIYGGTDNDRVEGGNDKDTLYGDSGNDTVDGGNAEDELFGGADNDRLTGGNAGDTLSGDDGNDTMFGDSGDDVLTAGTGLDSLFGGADRDLFFAGIGDTVDGGETGDDFDTLDLAGSGPLRVVYSQTNPENGIVEFLDANRTVIGTLTFSNIENIIPCFTPGTRIATPRGAVAVERLAVEDLVLTQDGGAQPLRWIGRKRVTAAEMARQPALAPVRIAKGALGGGLPARDLVVSPQHRVLVDDPLADLLFGERQVLIAALHLVGRPGVSREPVGAVDYLHLMFDRHEIILSDGAWTESFQPGDRSLAGMDAGQRAELDALFPALRTGGRFAAARRSLKAHEARVFLAA